MQESSEAELSSYETVSIRHHIEPMPKEALAMLTNANDDIREENRKYKKIQAKHLKNSKKEILETASAALGRIPQGQPKKALLLGVGNGFDIPLQKLAEQFDHLTLVELDRKSTENAIKQLPRELQEKIRLVEADITGVVAKYCQNIQRFISTTSSAKDFFKSASTMTYNIAEQSTKNTPDVGKDYTFVCSQLVLSQLRSLPGLYIEHAVKQKFDVELFSTSDNRTFLTNYEDLCNKLQQEHIRYLAESVSRLGTVHLADTYKAWLSSSSKQGYDEHDMILPDTIDPVLQENFTPRKNATNWIFNHTPKNRFYHLLSHSLEPKKVG